MCKLSYRYTLVPLFLIAFLLSGCGTTKPSRFYTLSSLSDTGSPPPTTPQTPSSGIGVGPVKLPRYLEQPQIVTRAGPNRFEFAEFDRWGGSLTEAFTRTLAENLTHLAPVARVSRHPWRRAEPIDFRIPVEVLRFDGQPGKTVTLNAQWQILSGDGETQLLNRRSGFTTPVEDTSYDAMVAALSRAVENLAREMADALRELQENVPTR